MSGEHSPCDALIPSMVADEALKEPLDLAAFESSKNFQDPRIDSFDFDLDDVLKQQCVDASESVKALIEDSDYSLLWFDEFGTKRISDGTLLCLIYHSY